MRCVEHRNKLRDGSFVYIALQAAEIGPTYATVAFSPPSQPYPILAYRASFGFQGREDPIVLQAGDNATVMHIGGLRCA
eukprot:scaffold312175_cov17-Prasinocladus_malaysianus.AAC.2